AAGGKPGRRDQVSADKPKRITKVSVTEVTNNERTPVGKAEQPGDEPLSRDDAGIDPTDADQTNSRPDRGANQKRPKRPVRVTLEVKSTTTSATTTRRPSTAGLTTGNNAHYTGTPAGEKNYAPEEVDNNGWQIDNEHVDETANTASTAAAKTTKAPVLTTTTKRRRVCKKKMAFDSNVLRPEDVCEAAGGSRVAEIKVSADKPKRITKVSVTEVTNNERTPVGKAEQPGDEPLSRDDLESIPLTPTRRTPDLIEVRIRRGSKRPGDAGGQGVSQEEAGDYNSAEYYDIGNDNEKTEHCRIDNRNNAHYTGHTGRRKEEVDNNGWQIDNEHSEKNNDNPAPTTTTRRPAVCLRKSVKLFESGELPSDALTKAEKLPEKKEFTPKERKEALLPSGSGLPVKRGGSTQLTFQVDRLPKTASLMKVVLKSSTPDSVREVTVFVADEDKPEKYVQVNRETPKEPKKALSPSQLENVEFPELPKLPKFVRVVLKTLPGKATSVRAELKACHKPKTTVRTTQQTTTTTGRTTPSTTSRKPGSPAAEKLTFPMPSMPGATGKTTTTPAPTTTTRRPAVCLRKSVKLFESGELPSDALTKAEKLPEKKEFTPKERKEALLPSGSGLPVKRGGSTQLTFQVDRLPKTASLMKVVLKSSTPDSVREVTVFVADEDKPEKYVQVNRETPKEPKKALSPSQLENVEFPELPKLPKFVRVVLKTLPGKATSVRAELKACHKPKTTVRTTQQTTTTTGRTTPSTTSRKPGSPAAEKLTFPMPSMPGATGKTTTTPAPTTTTRRPAVCLRKSVKLFESGELPSDALTKAEKLPEKKEFTPKERKEALLPSGSGLPVKRGGSTQLTFQVDRLPKTASLMKVVLKSSTPDSVREVTVFVADEDKPEKYVQVNRETPKEPKKALSPSQLENVEFPELPKLPKFVRVVLKTLPGKATSVRAELKACHKPKTTVRTTQQTTTTTGRTTPSTTSRKPGSPAAEKLTFPMPSMPGATGKTTTTPAPTTTTRRPAVCLRKSVKLFESGELPSDALTKAEKLPEKKEFTPKERKEALLPSGSGLPVKRGGSTQLTFQVDRLPKTASLMKVVLKSSTPDSVREVTVFVADEDKPEKYVQVNRETPKEPKKALSPSQLENVEFPELPKLPKFVRVVLKTLPGKATSVRAELKACHKPKTTVRTTQQTTTTTGRTTPSTTSRKPGSPAAEKLTFPMPSMPGATGKTTTTPAPTTTTRRPAVCLRKSVKLFESGELPSDALTKAEKLPEKKEFTPKERKEALLPSGSGLPVKRGGSTQLTFQVDRLPKTASLMKVVLKSSTPDSVREVTVFVADEDKPEKYVQVNRETPKEPKKALSPSQLENVEFPELPKLPKFVRVVLKTLPGKATSVRAELKACHKPKTTVRTTQQTTTTTGRTTPSTTSRKPGSPAAEKLTFPMPSMPGATGKTTTTPAPTTTTRRPAVCLRKSVKLFESGELPSDALTKAEKLPEKKEFTPKERKEALLPSGSGLPVKRGGSTQLTFQVDRLPKTASLMKVVLKSSTPDSVREVTVFVADEDKPEKYVQVNRETPKEPKKALSPSQLENVEFPELPKLPKFVRVVLKTLPGKATSVRAELKACHKPKTTVRTTQQTTTTTGRTTPSTTSRKPGSPAAEKLTFPMPSMPGATGKTTTTPAPTTTTRRPAVCLRKSVKLFESGELPSDALTKAEKLPEKKEFTPKERKEALLPSGSGLPVKRGGSTQLTFQVDRLPKTASLMKVVLKSSTPDSVREVTVFVADEDKPEKYVQVNRETPKEPKKALSPSQLENVEFPELPKLPKFVRVVLKTLPGKATSVRAELKACHKPKTTVRTTQQTTTTTGRTTPSTTSRKPGSPAAEKLTFPMPSMPGATGKTTTTPAPTTTTRRPAVCLRKSVKLFESGELPSDALTKAEKLPEKKEFTPKERKEALLPSGSGLPVKRGGSTQLTFQVDRLPKTASLMKVVLKSSTPDSVREVTVFVADEDKPEKYVQVNRETPKEPKKALSPSQLENVEFPELPKLPKFVRVVLKTLPGKATSVRAELKACHKPKTTVRTTQQTTTTTGRTTPSTTSRKPGSPAAEKLTFPMPSMPGATGKTTTTPAPTTTTRRPAVCLRKSVKLFESGELPSDALTKAEKLPEKKEFTPKERKEALLPSGSGLPVKRGGSTQLTFQVDRLPKTASLMKVVLKSSTPDSVREVTVFVADEDKPEKYVQVNRETPKEPKKALSPSQLENVEFPELPKLPKFVRVVLKTLPGKATSVRAELKACHKPKTTVRTTQQTTTTTGRTTPSTTSRKPGSPAAEKLTFPMPSMPGATGKTTTTPAPTTTTRRPAVCLRKSVKLFESGELPSDALTKAEKLPEKKEFTPKERKEALLPSGSGLPVKRGGSTQLTFQVDRLPKTASLMKVVLKSSTPDSVREVTVFVADEDKPEKYVQVNRETPKEPKKALSPSQLENVEFPELPKLPKFVRVVLKTLPGKATSVRAELKACHKPKTTVRTTQQTTTTTGRTTPSTTSRKPGSPAAEKLTFPMPSMPGATGKTTTTPAPTTTTRRPAVCLRKSVKLFESGELPSDALTKAEKLPEKKEFTPKERKEALLPSGSGLPVKRGGSTQLTFQVDRLPKTASLMKVVLKSSTPDSVREVTVFVADEDKPEKYVQVNRETPKEPKKALSPSQLENVEFPELPKLPKFVRVVLKTLPGKATSVRAELKACHKPKTTVRTTQQTTTTTGRTTPSTTSRKPGSPAAEKLTFPMPSMPGATGKTTTTPAPTTTTRRPAVCLRKSVKLFESGELPSDALTKAEKLPEKKEFTPKERKEALLPSGSGLPVKRGGSTQLTFQVDRLPKTASLMKVVLKSSTPDSVREVTVFVADEDKPEKYVQVNRETPKEPKKALSPSQLENVEFPELPKLPKFVRVVLKTLPGKATSVRAELKACHKPKTTVRTTQQTTTTTGRTTPSTTSRKPGSPAAEKLTFPMPSMPGATGKTTTTPAPTTTTRRPAVCLRKSVKLFESGELPSDALTKAEKLPEKKEFTPKERKEALLPSGSGLPVKRGGSTQLTFQVDRLPKTASLMKVVLKSSTPDSVREVTVFVADEDKPEKYVQVNRETPKEPKKALSPSQLENVEFPELPKLPKFVRVVLKTLPGKATSVRAELKACHKPKTTVRTTQQTTTTTGRTTPSTTSRKPGSPAAEKLTFPMPSMPGATGKTTTTPAPTTTTRRPAVCLRKSVKLFESGELPSDALTKAEKLPEKKEFTPKERKEALLPSGSGLPVKRGGSTQLTFQVDRLPKTASLMKVVLKSSTPDSVREVTVFVADEDKPEKYVQVNRETPKEPKKALSPSQLENVEFPELPKLPKFVRVVLKTLPGKATSVRAELKACHKPKTTVRTTQQTTTTTGRTTPSTTSRKPGSPAAEKLTFPMPSMPGATGKTTTTPAPTTTTRRPAVCLRKSVKLFESGELPSDALTKAEKLPEKKEFTPKERKEALLPSGSGLPVKRGGSTQLTFQVDRLPKTASLMKVVLKSSTPDSVREVTVFVADEDKPEKYVQVNRETPKEPKKALSPSQLENVEFPELPKLPKFVRVVLKTLPGKATSVRAELKACHKPKTTVRTTQQTTTTTGRTTPSTTSRKPGSPAAEKLTFPMPSMPGATGKTTTTPAPTTTTRRPAVCLRKSVKLFESGELPSDALTKAEKLPEKKEFTPKERKEALLPSGSGLPVKRGGSTQLTFQVDRLPKTASLMKVVLKSSTPDSVREVTVFVADEDKPEKYVQVNRETPKEPKKALSPSQLENVEFPELPKLPKFVRVVLKTLPGKATSVRAELKACHKPKTTVRTTQQTTTTTGRTTPSTTSRKPGSPAAEKLTFPMPSMPGATGKTTTTPAPTTTTRRPAVCLRKSVKLFESGELPSDALTKAEKLPEKKEFTPKERKEALLPSGSGLPVKRGGSTQLTFQVDRLPKTASLMKVVLKSSTPDSVREVTVFVADEDKPEKYVQVNRETPKEPKKALSPSQLENVEFPELPKLPKFVRVVLKTLPGKATSVRAELKACHKPKTTVRTTQQTTTTTGRTTPSTTSRKPGSPAAEKLTFPMPSMPGATGKTTTTPAPTTTTRRPAVCLRKSVKLFESGELPSDALTKAEKLPEKKEFTPKERKEALLPSGSGLPVKRGGSTQLTFQVDRLPKTASLMKVVLKSSTPDSVREVTVFVADEDKPEKYVQVNRETPKEPKKALSPSQLENVEFPELPKLPKFVRVVLKTLPGKATSVRAELKACHKPKTTVRTTQQTTTTTGRTTPSTTSRKPGSPAAEKLTFPMPSMPGATGKTTTTPAPTTTTRRPAVCLRKSVKLFESGELPSDALTKAEKLPEKKEFTPKERKEALLPSGSGLPVKRGGSTQLTFQVDRLPKTASLMKVVLKSSTPDSVREVTVFVADEDKPEKYVQVNRETPKEPKKALSPSQLENVEFPELPKLPKFVRVVLKTLPGKATSVRAELKACHKPKTTVRTTQQTTTTTGRTTPSTTSRKPGSPAAEKLTFPMPSMPGATGKTTTTPAPTTTKRRPAVCLRKSVKLFESGELPSDALTKAEKLPEKKEFTPKERKEALLPSGSGLPVKRGGSTQLTFQVDRLPKTASLMKVVLKSSTPDSVREVTVFVADEDKPEKYVQVNRETPKEPKKALSPSQLENVEFPELPKLPKFVRVVLKTLPGKATSVRAELKACHKPKTTVRTTQQTTTTTGRTTPSTTSRKPGSPAAEKLTFPMPSMPGATGKTTTTPAPTTTTRRPAVCLRKSVKLFESGELPSDALTKAEKLPEKKEFTPKERKEALLPSGSGLPVKRGGSTQLTFQVDRLPKTASLMKVVLKSSTPDSVREVTVFVADEDKPEKYVQVNRETPKEPKKALSPSQLENFVRVVLKTLPGKATSVRAELKACHKPKTTDDTTDDDHDGRTTPSTTSRKPGSPAAEKLTFPMPSMPGATGKTTTTPAPTTTTRRPAVCLRKSRALTKAEKLPEKKEFTPKERKEALLPSGSGLPVKRGGSTQLTFQVDRLPKTASLMKVVLKSSTPDSVREVTVFVADEDKPEKYVQVNRETPKEPKKALSPSQLENLPKLPKFVRVVLKTLPGKATSVRAELKACHKPKTTVRTTQQTTTTTGRTTPSTTSRKPGSPAAEKLTFPMPSMPGATGKTTTTPAPTTTTRRPAVCLRKSVKLFESGELPSDALTKAEKLPEKKEFTPKERKEALLPSGSGLPVKRGGSTQLTFQVDRLPKTASLMKVVLKSSTRRNSVREVTVFVADEDKPEKYVQVNRETPKEPKKALSPSQLENVEFPELPKAAQTTTTTGRNNTEHDKQEAGSPAAEKLTFPMPSMPGATGKTTTTPAPTTTTRRPAVCLRKSVKLFESGELPSDALTKAGEAPREEGVHTQGAKGALLPSGSGLPVKRGGSTQLTFQGGPSAKKPLPDLMKVVLKSSTPDSVREVTVFVADEDKPEKYVQVNRETPKEPKKALSPSQLENVEFPELPKLPKFVRVVLKTLPGKATSVRARVEGLPQSRRLPLGRHNRRRPRRDAQHRARQAGSRDRQPPRSSPSRCRRCQERQERQRQRRRLLQQTRRPAVCLRKSVKLFESGELPSDALTKAEKLPEKKEWNRLPKTASLMKVVLKSSTPDSVREYVQVNRETPKEPKKGAEPKPTRECGIPRAAESCPSFVRVVLKTLPGKATSVRAELKGLPQAEDYRSRDTPAAEKLTFPMPSMPGATGKTTTTPAPTTKQQDARPVCLRKSVKLFERAASCPATR
uniref:BRCT domain-containing protein n=1 Tax=Macrostomum lignano TaxID=282301 RepID=A0A1I8H5Z3_9PLAT